MTQEQHSTAPPPELVEQWLEEADTFRFLVRRRHQYVTERGAEWGANEANRNIERERQEAADQELEACCEWLDGFDREGWAAEHLRDDRRPKPPNLKDDAMEALLRLAGCSNTFASEDTADVATIRRALKSIPNPS